MDFLKEKKQHFSGVEKLFDVNFPFPPFPPQRPNIIFSSRTDAGVDSMTSTFPIGLGGVGSTFLTATVAANYRKYAEVKPEMEDLLEKIRATV